MISGRTVCPLGRRTQRLDTLLPSQPSVQTNLFSYNTRSELTNAVFGAAGSYAWAFDNIGNLTNDSVFACSCNGENRMMSVGSNGSELAVYSHDFMSRWVQKVVNGVTNAFVYDGWNLIRGTGGTAVVARGP